VLYFRVKEEASSSGLVVTLFYVICPCGLHLQDKSPKGYIFSFNVLDNYITMEIIFIMGIT
jgi:hypothetical protein